VLRVEVHGKTVRLAGRGVKAIEGMHRRVVAPFIAYRSWGRSPPDQAGWRAIRKSHVRVAQPETVIDLMDRRTIQIA
jgi:hypothetical protein